MPKYYKGKGKGKVHARYRRIAASLSPPVAANAASAPATSTPVAEQTQTTVGSATFFFGVAAPPPPPGTAGDSCNSAEADRGTGGAAWSAAKC